MAVVTRPRSVDADGHGFEQRRARCSNLFEMETAMANLVCGGVLERHPNSTSCLSRLTAAGSCRAWSDSIIRNEWHRRARVGSRLILAAGLMLMLSTAPADAQQDTGGSCAGDVAAGAFDLLVLRPMGVAGVAAGSVFFVASAPFVAPSGNLSETWDIFLYAPLEYTFARPLGVF